MNNEEKKINLNEESLVNDLKKSLDNTIQETLDTLNELVKNIESTIQDNEIQNQTKGIVKNFSEDLTKSLQQASDNLINIKNKKKISEEE